LSSTNPLTLVQSWRKLLPDLKRDDMQGFLLKKSEILDMVYAVRSFENIDKEML
jgi:hypothetical protein